MSKKTLGIWCEVGENNKISGRHIKKGYIQLYNALENISSQVGKSNSVSEIKRIISESFKKANLELIEEVYSVLTKEEF